MDPTFTRRYVNQGLSGGEQKKSEMLQMAMLEPTYAFLDETDSGLDVDALKTVAQHIKKLQAKQDMAIIVITHYKRFLDFFTPDQVLVMRDGQIVAKGGKELADKIEEEGFEGFSDPPNQESPNTTESSETQTSKPTNEQDPVEALLQ